MPAARRLLNTTALLLALTLTTACTRPATHADALARYQKGDYKTAFATWYLLAEQGEIEARYWLGTLYQKGQGVKKDAAASARWLASAATALQPLAEEGNANAQYLLGLMTTDAVQANQWFARAAEQGHANAQHTLGLAQFRGRNRTGRGIVAVEYWCSKAHDALLPLADAGEADAQYRIAVLYQHGCGVDKNRAERRRWLRQAAWRGHVQAQSNLGTFYLSAPKPDKNPRAALKWTRKAADKGYAAAQFNLGLMYETGRGVSHSQTEAETWYRRAADQGYGLAQKRVEMLDGSAADQNNHGAERYTMP